MNIRLQTQTAEKGPVSVIAGPWPSYASFRTLPERERWVLYGSAKAYREALENQGFVMAENYSDFINRVCRELDI
ncbi:MULTISPECIES: hypothetical protein [Pseudomonas]|uniref:hypothetical protein n=1 Tax=Pseudomonas TaxID=286 RepID=UPI001BE9D52D|nr:MULTISPECIES: hypothetical protein [Pseudomonas]MBT2339511.1 hypothetical protein [Pseudomonas fluorescens]MCD4528675.1 hypothetical protein [Pseudomonas sp. C3-2018]